MPQPSSPGAGNSEASAGPPPLVEAAEVLAVRGLYGLVWLDGALDVVARYGRVVDFVEIGHPVTRSLPALVGLEDDIRALREHPDHIVELPGVAMVLPGRTTPRFNLTIFWVAEQHKYMMLASRFASRIDLELELSQQIRARLIAEAEVTAKSAALERVNRELTRANADLEAFASIISHDLKAPLRAMRYHLEDLEAALDDETPDAAARDLLERAREQSRRMASMMGALLEYSRLGRKQEVVETVDLRQLVEAVVASLPRPAGIAVLVEGDWPRLDTLAAPFDLALRNLLDNAIKHHDRGSGRIAIACRDAAADIEVSVADDGPGIDPRHHRAIFLPFRRLSEETGAEGQGMGLAFVKRTVEGVGGRLSVTSDPAVRRGTTFTIYWPRMVSV